MKIMLAILGCLSLCCCAFAPESRDTYGDQHLAPSSEVRSGLGDPRTYMDKGDPNIQKLISSRSLYMP